MPPGPPGQTVPSDHQRAQAAAQAVPNSAKADSGAGAISAVGIGVPVAALDAAESAGVSSGVDPADVEKAETGNPALKK